MAKKNEAARGKVKVTFLAPRSWLARLDRIRKRSAQDRAGYIRDAVTKKMDVDEPPPPATVE